MYIILDIYQSKEHFWIKPANSTFPRTRARRRTQSIKVISKNVGVNKFRISL